MFTLAKASKLQMQRRGGGRNTVTMMAGLSLPVGVSSEPLEWSRMAVIITTGVTAGPGARQQRQQRLPSTT